MRHILKYGLELADKLHGIINVDLPTLERDLKYMHRDDFYGGFFALYYRGNLEVSLKSMTYGMEYLINIDYGKKGARRVKFMSSDN